MNNTCIFVYFFFKLLINLLYAANSLTFPIVTTLGRWFGGRRTGFIALKAAVSLVCILKPAVDFPAIGRLLQS